jgi:hypothetical protein
MWYNQYENETIIGEGRKRKKEGKEENKEKK